MRTGCPGGIGPCTKFYSNNWCTRHYRQYRDEIIDRDGNIHRDLKREHHDECLGKNSGTGECSHRIGGAMFCDKHRAQHALGILDINGNKLRNFKKLPTSHDECLGKNSGTGKCSQDRKNGRFCRKHRAHYENGIIDVNGNKLRDLKRIKHDECLGKNSGTGKCSQNKKIGRFCTRHLGQFHRGVIDINGNKLRELKCSKHDECLGKNSGTGECLPGRKNGSFCGKHKNQYYAGVIDINGKKLRNLSYEVTCGVPGCSDRAGWISGLCRKHRILIADGNFDRIPSLTRAPAEVEMVEVELGWWQDINDVL